MTIDYLLCKQPIEAMLTMGWWMIECCGVPMYHSLSGYKGEKAKERKKEYEQQELFEQGELP